MMNRAAVLAALPLLATAVTAHADDNVKTETAETLVVVTPNPPVIVQQGGPGAAEQPPAMPPVMVPQVAPAAQPAPQNEEWSNVSHINGQLVKIGERHEYLVRFKKENLSANPFGPFFGYYDAAYSHAVSQNLAITGSLGGYTSGDTSYGHTMFQASVSMPLYLRRTFDGPFLEPGIMYRSSTSGGGDYMTSKTWAGPELLFGWHWNFDSGLNISWAFGVAKHMSESNTDTSGYSYDESSKPDFNGYFRFGYNF